MSFLQIALDATYPKPTHVPSLPEGAAGRKARDLPVLVSLKHVRDRWITTHVYIDFPQFQLSIISGRSSGGRQNDIMRKSFSFFSILNYQLFCRSGGSSQNMCLA